MHQTAASKLLTKVGPTLCARGEGLTSGQPVDLLLVLEPHHVEKVARAVTPRLGFILARFLEGLERRAYGVQGRIARDDRVDGKLDSPGSQFAHGPAGGSAVGDEVDQELPTSDMTSARTPRTHWHWRQ
jgi:hypothetical protein